MAGLSIYDDTLSGALSTLSTQFGEIAQKALKEASPVLTESMKKNARAVIRHEGDSEMVKSIKAKAPKKTKNGAWIANVVPTGYSSHYFVRSKGKKARKYKVSNGAKMVWLEYGNRGGKQPARPFIKKAVNDVEGRILDVIQDEVNNAVDKAVR